MKKMMFLIACVLCTVAGYAQQGPLATTQYGVLEGVCESGVNVFPLQHHPWAKTVGVHHNRCSRGKGCAVRRNLATIPCRATLSVIWDLMPKRKVKTACI